MKLARHVVLLPWIAACGGAGSPDAGTVTEVTDSAGIQIVLSDSIGRFGEMTRTETLRLGAMEGEGPELFSDILALALGPDGRIFVGNNGSASVRVFDRDGTFLAEYGGQGEGPSEIFMLNDLVVHGDTVVVTDWQRGGKVVLFTSDGEFLDSWRVTQVDGTRIQPVQPYDGGWLTDVSPPYDPPTLEPGELWLQIENVHHWSFGSTEPGPVLYESPGYPLYGVPGEEGGVDWSLFRPTTSRAFDQSGRLYITRADAYQIDIREPGAGVTRIVRREYTPRRITEADVEELRAAAIQVIDTMSRLPSEEVRAQQRRQINERIDRQARLPMPEIASPLGTLLVDTEGAIWVERLDTSNPGKTAGEGMFGLFGGFPPDESIWDRFDAEGSYLGFVRLPPRFRPEAVQGDDVVGVWADGFDVEHVVRYTVLGG